MRRLGPDPVPYVTRSEHVGYPAGTACEAFRRASKPSKLVLRYSDGHEVELDHHIAEGLEDHPAAVELELAY